MSTPPSTPGGAGSPDPDDQAQAQAEAAESAAIRRRWITLGEILAVVAVIISGLTLYNNWAERGESKAVKEADAKQASAKAATLVLMAGESGKRSLELKPASDDQSVQSQKVLFPSALEVPPAETTGEPRIEASWFDGALQKARNAAKLPDDSRGDERLPVVITTRFLVNGEPHEDVALYDIGYTISGKFLSGHTVTLRGLSMVSRIRSGSGQAQLDARWKRILPAAQP
ncbi:hypothetical protein TPR58_10750 [Sphingomonas sp. HF-S3]|uniref:Uncharacterized protein n=1 Tax=Sphingomonas rustica TaxID=3103142 RepID=A0ABV0B7T9_9SPHN